jgi:hypothetical protein
MLLLCMLSATAACSRTRGPTASDAETVVRLRGHVVRLSVDFAPRDYRHLENLNAAADYIATQFTEYGAEVHLQRFEVDGVEYVNVVARYQPSADSLRIVGAHYDAHVGTPGADDNASGVAGLLEIARRISEFEQPPAVELVAYSLEEPPFYGSENMGSFVHADDLHERGIEVEWMIALEMIGYFSDEPGSQQYPMPGLEARFGNRGNFIAVVSKLDQTEITEWVHDRMQSGTDLPVRAFNGPEKLPGVDFSDHRNYWEFGMPAVMVTDTAFFRNQEYHSPGDTYDRLDYDRMAKVVDGVMKVIKIER